MRPFVCFTLLALAAGAIGSASAGEAMRSAGTGAPAENPCAAYTENTSLSQARALLDCQNASQSKTTPHMTGAEASKVYEAYIGKVSKDIETRTETTTRN